MQHRHWGMAVQFAEDVAAAGGDAHRLPDGAAALRHYGVDDDVAAEGQADGAGVVYFAVQKEGVVAGALGAAGQPADFGRLGKGEIQPHNQVLHRKGKGVGQQHELGFVGRGDAQEFLPGVGAGVKVRQLFAIQVKGGNVHAGEGGGGDR